MTLKPDTIIRNSVIANDGMVLTSVGQHDYVTHLLPNGALVGVDGGLEYRRRIGEHTNYRENSISYGQGHTVCREIPLWTTYGKSGKKHPQRVSVSQMETSHMMKILNETPKIHPTIKQVMTDEISMRKSLTHG